MRQQLRNRGDDDQAQGAKQRLVLLDARRDRDKDKADSKQQAGEIAKVTFKIDFLGPDARDHRGPMKDTGCARSHRDERGEEDSSLEQAAFDAVRYVGFSHAGRKARESPFMQ